MSRFATFGQELYFDESIRAIESFPEIPEHDHLAEKITEFLPHPSQSTKLRVATKIIQRFFKSPDGKSHATAFIKLVNSLKSESARRDLLYWRAARTDTVIAALAREVFYPYFVLNAVPEGYDESAFQLANTATLFAIDKVISRDFAVEYARRIWDFDSARTITLALRIMKQAEILDTIIVKLGRRHVHGYYPQPHSARAAVFAYCMYEEFSADGSPPSIDRVLNGDCAKLFFLSPLQVESLLKTLEKKKLIQYLSMTGGRYIHFTPPDLDTLVNSLI